MFPSDLAPTFGFVYLQCYSDGITIFSSYIRDTLRVMLSLLQCF